MLSACTINSGLTVIPDYTFSGCKNLKEFIIPSSVTSIGFGGFATCLNLTKLIIPSGVTLIRYYAFQNCYNILECVVNAPTPPTLSYNSFDMNKLCKIKVPPSSVATYKAATNWKRYASQIISQ
jgi:hypothetical protein